MSYLKDVKSFRKDSLSSVETVITKHSGRKVKQLNLGEEIPLDDHIQKCVDGFFVLDLSADTELHCVCDGLYIGSQDSSSDYEKLKEKDITHVLNVAVHTENHFPGAFTYKKIEMFDIPSFDISLHFEECADFIHDAIDINKGAVLCHCNAGISRSSTVIIAYLMRYKRMTMDDALDMVVKARPVAQPNTGFLLKLKEYENNLMSSVCIKVIEYVAFYRKKVLTKDDNVRIQAYFIAEFDVDVLR